MVTDLKVFARALYIEITTKITMFLPYDVNIPTLIASSLLVFLGPVN